MSASALAALLDRSVRRVAVRLSELEARGTNPAAEALAAFLATPEGQRLYTEYVNASA